MLRNQNTYDAYVEGLYALYHQCECHDSPDHEVDMRCPCDVCYSNTMDILYDRERDLKMEREWDKRQNR